MGVVSNKVDINYLKLHTDVGNLDTRVTTLEGEMTGVYASINQISTVELPKVYSSISEVSNLILKPVTGLEDRVEEIEEHIPKIVKIPLSSTIPEAGTAAKNIIRVLAVDAGTYYESSAVPNGAMFIPFYAYAKEGVFFYINSIVLKKGTDATPAPSTYNFQRIYRGSAATTNQNKIHIITAFASWSGDAITDTVISGTDGAITLNDLSSTNVVPSDEPFILAFVC